MKKKLNIIYEDKELLVIDKPSNLLTIATSKERNHTLYKEVREYIHKKNQKVFIVNRLDKDTSGIVVFAKNERLKRTLQDNWNDIAKRYYIAVVEGKVKKKEDTLIDYLYETKTLDVFVSKTKDGKKSILKYKVIDETSAYSMLDIEIKTGRRNQIRCQLDNMGNNIIGDKKYGAKKNPIGRLGLHAYKLILSIPGTKKEYIFESKMPQEFSKIFQKN